MNPMLLSLKQTLDKAQTLLQQLPQWVASVLGAALIFLSVVPLPAWLLCLYLLILTALLMKHFMQGLRLRRALFFERWLSETSSLQKFKEIGKVRYLFLVFGSLALSVATALSLFTFKWASSLALILGTLLGLQVFKHIKDTFIAHANEVYQPLLCYRWRVNTAICFGALFFVSWELFQSRDNYSNLSAVHAADTVIEETNHPIKLVQDYSRTLHYVGLNMRRLRDNLGDSSGQLIYLYLILPNIIPLWGVVAALNGLKVLSQKQNRKVNENIPN